MNEVERYDVTCQCGCVWVKVKHDGHLVLNTDYASLQEQLTATTNSLNDAQEALKSAGIEVDTVQAGVMELKAQRDALAAENAALKSAISYVCDTDNLPDYQYDGMGCGIEDRGIVDRYEAARYGWDEAIERIYSEVILFAEEAETPATDAYLNAVRAEAIPEGYVLVPQQMHLSADAMESLCFHCGSLYFHCGDGGFTFGEFTEGLLWVGDIENDDGTKTYGLNIVTADYPDEGSANISEFANPLRSGNAGKDGSHE